MVTRRDLLKSGGLALAATVAGLRPSSIRAYPIEAANEEDVTQFVNPFIGTGAHGHTYPGATVPFGLVQLSPDSGTNGWDWCSGYNYADKKIAGFSHTHLSGTGIGDLCDIRFTPVMLDGKLPEDLRSDFTHDKEEAQPGFYAVHLSSQNIKVELTATERVGVHRYAFQSVRSGQLPSIVIDLGAAVNWDNPTDTYIKVENPTTISGHRMSSGWAKDQHIYFVAEFSKPIASHELFESGAHSSQTGEIKGKKVKALFTFQNDNGTVILTKVGISAVSIDGARRNLEAEAQGWDFDQFRKSASVAWNKELSKIKVAGDSKKKTIFYTSLYHSMLAPTLFCDVDGSYIGPDKQVHQAKDFKNYTTFSLWDTFRAEHPLFTLFQPDRVNDLIQSMMAFYRESGLLPVWPLVGNETNTMIGYHSVPVIADAYFKKLTSINPSELLEAMKQSALQDANGLRFYQIPEPTTIAKLRSQVSPEMKRVGIVGEEILKHLDILCSGYRKSISGNAIGYHSPYPNVKSALITRTQNDKSAIEWESAPTPNNIEGEKVTFVWLAGLNTSRSQRSFQLYVNGEKWFTFKEPESSLDISAETIATNGAKLQFCATHKDQYDGLFGFMFLTVPAGVMKPGEPVRFRAVGESAGTDDWYMTFEHEIKQQVNIKNEYAFVNESNTDRQVILVEIEHVGTPAEALISIDGQKYGPIPITVGTNTQFVPVPKVEKETLIQVGVTVDGDQIAAVPFKLRPVTPYNYIPADKEVESVSKTLECAYDDWCIAQMAKEVARVEDYHLFTDRSQFYRNVYDKETGFMRGKLADGSWRTPFSPKFSEHRQDDYTEANAWQATWFVPHEIDGLIELMGGEKAFIAKLDRLFNESSDLEGTSASPDISGMIGQYAHGNEPSHHIAYLYALAGRPWNTQERIRNITKTLYTEKPDGLCGNEDCGQMSAWYVLSAIGIYPVNPANGVYIIGTPHFQRATISIGKDRQFTVIANNVSDENIYIQKARLNGASFNRCYIRHDEIIAGGTLVFDMGNKPNKRWGIQGE